MGNTMVAGTVESCVQELGALRRRRQRAAALLLALAAIVAAGVFWQLHSTGVALSNEALCGMEEHTHAADCYESVLTCGLEESESHTHDASCYEEQLVCGMEEHTHTAECYSDGDADAASGGEVSLANEDDGISLAAISGENTVAVGESITLTGSTGYNRGWTSSDDTVATVTGNGATATVTGVSAGTVTITHSYRDGQNNLSEEYSVTVTAAGSIVLNLGNGNGVLQDSDYSGGSQGSGGTDLRYTVNVSAAAGEDGTATIKLPADSDLDTIFTVATAADGTAITQTLGNEAAPYDWTLVGWVNIATGEYYDVSGGSVTATVDLSKSNVFYADWVAESYDYGSSSTLGVDTSDFVTINMFDYNELFNMYSASLTQSGLTSESWADSGSLYSSILGGGSVLDNSFIFHNSRTNNSSDSNSSSNGLLGYVTGLKDWNSNNEQPYTTWSMDSASSSPVLSKLYDTSGETTGVTYVGSGNYLFQVDEDGYYYFDSDEDGAAYNQSAQRFYLSSSTTTVTEGSDNYGSAFFPYNEVGTYTSISDGTLNYWFGMSMEMDFYLPNNVGTSGGNQYNDADMVFEFSGDDDIWVFVDDKLVLNMSGVHSEMEGSINFSTGDVNVNGKGYNWSTSSYYSYKTQLENCSAGTHTLKVYYMERGAWDSNLSIKFNIVPRWQYETASAGTMSVTKEWEDADGNAITDTSSCPDVVMGLFEKTEAATSVGNSYTVNGTTYTLDGEGYSYDTYGQVNAYASGGYLYVRVDTVTLTNQTDWTYTWELLDENKTYEVLELTTLADYTTAFTSNTLQSWGYWSAVGYEELNGSVSESDGTYTRTGGLLENGLQVVLTDGAQNGAESTKGFPTTCSGYVIKSTDDGGATTATAQFSQAASDADGDGTYTYGVTSDSQVAGATWYVELTGKYNSYTVNNQAYYAPTFYLKTAESGGKYLAISDNSLTLVYSKESATAFAYNSLGELNTTADGGKRVIIISGGYSITTLAESTTDTRNVKIYVKQSVATSGKAYTVTNTQLPTITLKKVSSTSGGTTLGGAVFTLQDSEGSYYRYVDGSGVAWGGKDDATELTTADGGTVSIKALADGTYTLTEVTAPDGYNLLSSAVTFTVSGGKVTEVSYGGTGDNVASIDSSEGNSRTITVTNTPGVELPNTGGSGTLPFALAGFALCAAAGAGALLLGRRKGRA